MTSAVRFGYPFIGKCLVSTPLGRCPGLLDDHFSDPRARVAAMASKAVMAKHFPTSDDDVGRCVDAPRPSSDETPRGLGPSDDSDGRPGRFPNVLRAGHLAKLPRSSAAPISEPGSPHVSTSFT